MDGGATLWTCGTGETSGLVTSYTKGEYALLFVGIKKGDNFGSKLFKKADGNWNEISLEEFKKAKEMMETPVESTEHDLQEINPSHPIEDTHTDNLIVSQYHSEESSVKALVETTSDDVEEKKEPADKHIESPETPKEEVPPSDGQMGEVMDLASIYQDNSLSFDYSFSGNAVQLIVPKKGVSVQKIVRGSEAIWTPEDGETFGHARVYLNKDGKAELVLVVTTSSGASKEYYLELQNGKWVSCNDKDAKMRSLRDPADYISDFELDLSLANSTNECSIFETELLGVTTKHFFPKPGYLANEVKDGSKEVWKSAMRTNRSGPGNFDGYCLSCLIYEKGDIKILEMIVVENSSRWYKYFEKTADGEWKVDKGKFLGKLKVITEGSTLHPSQ